MMFFQQVYTTHFMHEYQFFNFAGDCSPLPTPDDCSIQYTSTAEGFQADYTLSCSTGCQPVGDLTRTCTANGWSGTAPYCPGTLWHSNVLQV